MNVRHVPLERPRRDHRSVTNMTRILPPIFVHSIPMNHQSRVIWELFPTNLAGTLLQASATSFFVHSHMQSQTVPSIESNAASVTTILSLILVNSYVLLQSRAVFEHFIAMWTLDTVSFMRVHVLRQTVKWHRLPANLAFPLISNRLMFSDSMMSQARGILEIRAAILAKIRSQSCMNGFQMKAQFLFESKFFRTFWTLINFLQTCMLRLQVLVQSSLVFESFATNLAKLTVKGVNVLLLVLTFLSSRIQNYVAIFAN